MSLDLRPALEEGVLYWSCALRSKNDCSTSCSLSRSMKNMWTSLPLSCLYSPQLFSSLSLNASRWVGRGILVGGWRCGGPVF